ncbi:MAG: hypothetical protein IJN29_05475, partial [Akkermansia sp.]|nr:hypothetical protein [Akkermansia sp.]
MFILATSSTYALQFIKECWSNINGGSELFIGLTFTILASATISSKIRDYLIAPPSKKKQELEKEIEETEKFIHQAKSIVFEDTDIVKTAFDECRKDIENQHDYLRRWLSLIVKWTRLLCGFSIILLFYVIITKQNDYGFLPLFLLLPLPIARTFQKILYWNANNTYEAQRKRLITIKELRNVQYQAEEKLVDYKLNKKLDDLRELVGALGSHLSSSGPKVPAPPAPPSRPAASTPTHTNSSPTPSQNTSSPAP